MRETRISPGINPQSLRSFFANTLHNKYIYYVEIYRREPVDGIFLDVRRDAASRLATSIRDCHSRYERALLLVSTPAGGGRCMK